MIILPTGRTTTRNGIADANRALARYTDILAQCAVLTPRYLRSVSAEPIIAGRLPGEEFSRGQAEATLSALRTVNALIEDTLHQYGDGKLSVVLETVSRSAPAEIRLLAAREATLTDRHSLYLYQSAALTLTLQTWYPGMWTAWHDHACERLAFQVVEGYLQEMRYEGRTVNTFWRAADNIYTCNPTTPHRIGDGSGISLHAYAPWLEQMARFAETPSGDLAIRAGRPVFMHGGE
jgi:hypothetical protein